MDHYIVILTVIGFAALGMAWMPGITKLIKVSYSIVYILFGVLLYQVLDVLPSPNPLVHPNFTLHITELIVIISLMGTGLKIDEPFSLRGWKIPIRLVSITMLLSIGLVALLGWQLFGFSMATSLLLGAALAPTDPVLASDVQVGPPLEKSKNDVRFSLTAEAGLNDGMAFPFTWLAITIALLSEEGTSLEYWFIKDFLYRIVAGGVIGYLIGRLLSYLLFTLPEKKNFMVTRDGFVAISTTLVTYGVTELIQGYGFIAVFICAITIRNSELHHKYHKKLHSFTDQVERILMAIVLILFGGSLINGIISEISWPMIIFAAVCIFLIRPFTSYITMANTGLHQKEKLAISFFGIKGLGSFFYLSFALQKASFENEKLLWSIVALVVLCSIVIHGLTASIAMKKIHKQFGRET